MRLVDLRVGFRRAMDIECLGRFPSLDEQEDLRIGLRVVDLEPQAAWFHSRKAALLAEPIADRGNVLLIVDGQENVGVDHAGSLGRIDFHPSGYLGTAKNARASHRLRVRASRMFAGSRSCGYPQKDTRRSINLARIGC